MKQFYLAFLTLLKNRMNYFLHVFKLNLSYFVLKNYEAIHQLELKAITHHIKLIDNIMEWNTFTFKAKQYLMVL